MTLPVFHAIGGALVRNGRGGGAAPAPPSGPGDSGVNQTGIPGKVQTGTGIVAYSSLAGATVGAKLAAAGAQLVALPVGTQTFSDFSGTGNSGVGLSIPASLKGLLGAGSASSTLQMVPNSSTHAGTNPAQSTGSSIQLQYLYVVNPASGFLMDGIKMLGTEQGHLYNGWFIQGATKLTVQNCSFNHVPGNAGAPPGETFAINLYAQEDTTGVITFKNVTVDGQGIGAAGLGVNRSRGQINIIDTVTKNLQYSAGIALWEIAATSVVNIRNNVMSGNRRNLGLESHGGTVNVYDPLWGDHQSAGHDVNMTWGIASGATWKNGTLNFFFTDNAAWLKFIDNRTVKKITIVTNPNQDYGSGLVPDGQYNDMWNSCNVYVGGVKKVASDYITFSGTRI